MNVVVYTATCNMQKLLLFFSLVVLSVQSQAQFKALGLKTGVNYGESVIKETFNSNGTDFTYATHEADVAIAWGIFARAKFLHFFFQPELMASNHQTKMKLSSVTFDSIISMKQNRVDIPLLVGYSRKDRVRAFMGPVYTRNIENGVFTEKFLFEELRTIFQGGTWGYQLGFGFDMGRLCLDARYETSLGRISNQVTIKNRDFQFDHRMNTVQVTLGWDMVK